METVSSIHECFLRKNETDKFTICPNWLRDIEGMKGLDKMVYIAIKSYAWEYIFCYPCLDTIAKHVDCTIPTLITSINRLVNRNLLIVLSRKLEGKSNIF